MMQPFLQRLGAVGATAGSYQSLLREVQLLHRALSCLCDRPASSLQQETTTQSSTSTLHQFQGLASHRHRHATTLAAAVQSRPQTSEPQQQVDDTAQRRRSLAGTKVTTTAPWPWVDPTRPQVLPVMVGTQLKPRPCSLSEAIDKVKANIAERRARLSDPTQQSGRWKPRGPEVQTVELVVTTQTDPRRGDQIVRGAVVLPHGTGKRKRIAVFAAGPQAEIARAEGADVVGDEELISAIIASGGTSINFDTLIATPDFMRPLAKAGRILGPKGLMPNPKMGTLTPDVGKAVREARAGRVEFRVTKENVLHVVMGKTSFPPEHLRANVAAFMKALLALRPAALPGSGFEGFITAVYLKSTQTPAVPVSPASCLAPEQKPDTAPEQAGPTGAETA